MFWRIHNFPRYRLINLPTPLEKAARLSSELGVELYVKRDDVMELALGGNKVRKLKFILGDALSKGCDILITKGAFHSNHARLTAAASRKAGLETYLVLYPPGTSELKGNLLLDVLFGAKIIEVKDSQEANEVMVKLSRKLESEGRRPYIIPGGGASPHGVLGYVNAFLEILQQLLENNIRPDYIVLATGTGATQAGLVLEAKLLGANTEIIGVSVGRSAREEKERIAKLVNDTAELLGSNIRIEPEEIIVFDKYTFGGYGVITKEVIETIKYVALTEGLLLDPVYTTKAMSGLLDLIGQEYIRKNSRIVFLHTGGIPIIFQYNDVIKKYLQ